MTPAKLGLQMPSQQVLAGGIGALLIYGAIQAVRYFWGFDAGLAADVALEGIGTTLVAHLTPPSAVDIVKHVNDDIALAGTAIGNLSARSDSGQPMTTAAIAIATAAK